VGIFCIGCRNFPHAARHPTLGTQNLQSTLCACNDLDQQVSRLKHLAGSFKL
jgi:hypothetical protein